MGGGGVEVSIASCSGSGVAAGAGLGVVFGGSAQVFLSAGGRGRRDVWIPAARCCCGCGCEPCVCNEKSCVWRSRVGRSFPSWLGNGASPVGAFSLAAREFAFDSKVCSFGASAVSFDGSVSMNCGLISGGGVRRGQIDDRQFRRCFVGRNRRSSNIAERSQGKPDGDMEKKRDEDREPELTALFLFFAHFGATPGRRASLANHIAHPAPNNLPASTSTPRGLYGRDETDTAAHIRRDRRNNGRRTRGAVAP